MGLVVTKNYNYSTHNYPSLIHMMQLNMGDNYYTEDIIPVDYKEVCLWLEDKLGRALLSGSMRDWRVTELLTQLDASADCYRWAEKRVRELEAEVRELKAAAQRSSVPQSTET